MIGNFIYSVCESIDGKLQIIKSSDDNNTEEMLVFPRSGNIIHIE